MQLKLTRRVSKIMIALAVLVLVVSIAATSKLYFIRDDVGGVVLWNSSEADFFIGVSTRGRHVTWLGYPWFLFKHLLGGFAAADLPNQDRGALAVIHVTSSGVERHEVDQKDREPGSGPSLYTPRNGRIYVDYPALGGLCVWAGDHFEPAELDGKRGREAFSALIGRDFENRDGWSKRGFGILDTDSSFTLDVGDKFELSVNMVGVRRTGRGKLSIDMHKSGAPSRIFNFDARNERVSRREYRDIFSKGKVLE